MYAKPGLQTKADFMHELDEIEGDYKNNGGLSLSLILPILRIAHRKEIYE